MPSNTITARESAELMAHINNLRQANQRLLFSLRLSVSRDQFDAIVNNAITVSEEAPELFREFVDTGLINGH